MRYRRLLGLGLTLRLHHPRVIVIVKRKALVESAPILWIADNHFIVVVAGIQIVWVWFEKGWQVESFSDVVDLEELGERIRGVPETLCLLLGQGSQGLWKLSRDCW